MSYTDRKITQAEINAHHVQGATDYLIGNPQQNKAVFDNLPEFIAGKFNDLVDEITGQHGDEIREAVDEWLAEHPEVTTTVQDNSLTTAKYVDGSVTEPKIANGSVTPSKLDRVYTTPGDLTEVNNALTNEINVLDARMDEFASLPEGSTSGNAELLDIRVGANGTTYPTAGGAVRGQIADLKSDLSVVTDERTIPVERAAPAYFDVGAKVIVVASYTRMVYAPIDGNTAEKVTVSKTLGKLFRVGFTAVKPDVGVSIIDEAGTYIDAGEVTSTTVNVPSTAKYVVATIWNANTDASTTSAEDMIASVVITANYGAKDIIARQQIVDTNEKLANLHAEDINTFTRTGWNYLDDALVEETGKYWNGATIGSPISLADNASYNAVMIEADASIYKYTPARFVHALDANGNLLQVVTTDGTSSFDNRTLQASYLCFTLYASSFSTAVIYKEGTASFAQYTASGQWVFPDLVTDTDTSKTIYLPSKVYCAVGRTIELYNEQVCLNADKYHVNWVCDVGVAYKRKFSVTGANANIGTHSLTFNLYDDNYKLVASKTASLIISANSIASTIKVLPIGDSLTNGKEWLSEVPTLANNKIEYIGTRRLEGRLSEGRSGASSGWYVVNSSYTYADGSTYVGNSNVLGSSNPFWDGSKFSLNHYITQQASYVGTPDAVQFMLGTNDLKQTATVVANIKTMVDTIHTEYPTMPIFICNAIFHSNQNGYYSTGGEGYIGVMTNWQYELDRYTIALMSALAEVFDNDTYNSFVTLVPVATCMDRENDFGQVSVPVNPRLTSVTEIIPSQYTHPQSAGYLQMADAMYSAYCAKLS